MNRKTLTQSWIPLTAILCQGALPSVQVGKSRDAQPSRGAAAPDAAALAAGGSIVLGQRRLGPPFLGGVDSGDRFGASAALLGDLDGDGVGDVAVGAPSDDDGGLATGTVWILFLDPDGGVRSAQGISNSQGGFSGVLDGGDTFGTSLAALGHLDGDGLSELAVGAPGGGTLWILFLESDGTVRSHQRLGGSLTEEQRSFGSALAALGDLDGDGVADLAAGVSGDDDGGTNQGAVRILFLEVDGSIRSESKISATQGNFLGDLDPGDQFGAALAFLGDLDGDGRPELAVGADQDDDGASNQGALWILSLLTNGTVHAHAKVSATQGGFTGDLDPSDRFGVSATGIGDLDGDGEADLAVGASGDDDGGINRGAVWVLFRNSDGTIRSQQKISATQGGFAGGSTNEGAFGRALASGTLGTFELLVGAPHLGNAASDGRAHLLALQSDGFVADASEIDLSPPVEASDQFGGAFTLLGDIDGDGLVELAVGAHRDGPGAVWLLSIGAQGAVERAEKLLLGGLATPFDRLGLSLATPGDLDGNGVPDLAVGAPFAGESPEVNRGSLFVLFLASDGALLSSQEIAESVGGFTGALDARDRFARSLAALGDLDGDGVGDLAVGVPGDDDGGAEKGAVWILFLNADGTVREQQKISATAGGFGSLITGDRFGTALAVLGDLDGDGIVELAAGAPGDDADFFQDVGAVWVLFLNADGTVRSRRRLGLGEGGFGGLLMNGDGFGTALAALGDLDGDGDRELAVGAPGDDTGGASFGAIWILYPDSLGRTVGQAKISAAQGHTDAPEAGNFGSSLAGVGDWNEDGLPDLVAGAPSDNRYLIDAGMSWVFFLDGVVRVTFETESDLTTPLENGRSLASSGALDGFFSLSSSGAHLGPAVFDSTPGGPNDPSPDRAQDRDLLVDLGNHLILQNAQVPTQTVPGIFDHPNDDHAGGLLTFAFDTRAEALSLDLIDIDLSAPGGASVALFDELDRSRLYTVSPGFTEDLLDDGPPAWRTLDLTSLDPQPGFTASASAVESAGFDPTQVVRIEVTLQGSGAVDNLKFVRQP